MPLLDGSLLPLDEQESNYIVALVLRSFPITTRVQHDLLVSVSSDKLFHSYLEFTASNRRPYSLILHSMRLKIHLMRKIDVYIKVDTNHIYLCLSFVILYSGVFRGVLRMLKHPSQKAF